MDILTVEMGKSTTFEPDYLSDGPSEAPSEAYSEEVRDVCDRFIED